MAYAKASQEATDNHPEEFVKLIQSLPEQWFEVYTRAIELCSQLDRPAIELLTLRHRLGGLVNAMGTPSTFSHPHLLALDRQLAHASALDDFAALDPEIDHGERVRRAFAIAQERYRSSSEKTRLFEPQVAFKQLIRSHLACVGNAALALDYDVWSQLPSLRPFLTLSPAIGVIEHVMAGVGARLAGRVEDVRDSYYKTLKRTAEPDRAGIDESNHRWHRYGVMTALGIVEAAMGLASCLDWAAQIENDPFHTVSAMQIRILHHLWQGRAREADQLREQVELLRIQSSARQISDGLHLPMQVVAHALSDDLTRIKHALDETRVFSQRHPAWEHVVQYASGEYQRIRGDHEAAAQQLWGTATQLRPGTHPIWPFAAGAYVHVLGLLGRHAEACKFGRDSLLTAEQAGLHYVAHYIRMPLAVVCAESGEVEFAAELADAVIASMREIGSDGLSLVLSYESRARVAVCAKDISAYETFAKLCAERCRAADSRVLGAKYERLVRLAAGAGVHVREAAPSHLLATLTGTQLTSVLVGCHNPSDRAERALQLLLRASGAEGGFLYLLGDQGPELAAQVGPNEPSLGLPSVVSEFIDGERQDRELTTRSLEHDTTPSFLSDERGMQHRLVLLSHQMPDGFAVTGVAALVLPPGAPFTHPGALASQLSRLTFDAGDVTPILM